VKRFCAVVLLAMACRRAPVAPPPAPFPTSMETIAGRVEVRLVPNLYADSTKVWGVWWWGKRLIEIEANAPTWIRWHTLHHELCHVSLDASGLANVTPDKMQEAICDAMASNRMRER
jgi:hypothetical protein